MTDEDAQAKKIGYYLNKKLTIAMIVQRMLTSKTSKMQQMLNMRRAVLRRCGITSSVM